MRSGIPARYSEGFHPHQLMSFAYPLAVSMETEGDYMDLQLLSEVPEEELLSALNKVMNEGVSVSRATLLKEGSANAMALVAAADYLVRIPLDEKILEESCAKLLAQKELLNAKGKDIRGGIFELSVKEGGIFMKLKSGSAGNVRPADVYTLLSELGTAAFPAIPDILRLEIYGEEDGVLKPLSDIGALYEK